MGWTSFIGGKSSKDASRSKSPSPPPGATSQAAAAEPAPTKSGAAGSAIFPGSDSRKYNYFEPKGKRATHYEDMTVDVQPDPERYLLQDWIISFASGAGGYEKEWTEAKSSDWHKYRAPDQEWEKTHYMRQSTIVGMVQNVVNNARRAGAPANFDPNWIKVLQTHVGAWKHVEFGLGTALMQAQRYGYTQMINNSTLTNSSYKLRFAQDLILYLGEISMDIPALDVDAGKRAWMESPIWQGTREAVETIRGLTDYLEQYFSINICFEPLVGEVFRSGFVMHAAPANRDFVTPAVVSSAEADYQRNLANAVELFYMLRNDPQYGAHNKAVFERWAQKHIALATKAAQSLQPIWSEPSTKAVQFVDSFAAGKARLKTIASEIDIALPAEISQ